MGALSATGYRLASQIETIQDAAVLLNTTPDQLVEQ